MARRATYLARLAGQTRHVQSLTLDHGFPVGGADVAGLSGSVVWDDAAPLTVPALPTDDTWDRDPGTDLTVDWTDNQGTVRLATARLEGSDGDSLGALSSSLTDWTSRLETEVEVRPVAWAMPRNIYLPGSTTRRVGLWGCWVTHEALRQSGWNASQAMQTSAVAYHSMCGSVWPSPDPDSTYLPLGDLRQAHRLVDYGQPDPSLAPSVVQGDDCPCMTNVYALGITRTRRNSSVAHWQLTVDLGVSAPTVYDYGRVTLRPVRSGDGAGIRLDWTQTLMRVVRVDPGGATTILGTYARSGTLRWSVVVRADGTATLRAGGGRGTVATLSSTGVTALPTGSGEASYLIESPGTIGTVQIGRSDSAFLTTQQVGARILRSTFGGRSLAAFDWIPPTGAGQVLATQARREVGWRGMLICQWIDEDGRLINADFSYLAAQPVMHAPDTDASDEHALDGTSWSLTGQGPYREVAVTSRWARVRLRNSPTVLLGEGSRTTVERGELLEQIIHPREGQTWLSIDTDAYLAGHPYPSPPYPSATQHEYARGVGTWIGGHRQTAEDGTRVGWLEIGHVPEWTLDAAGHVQGALTVLDPRTVLVSGTMRVLAGEEVSTMPDPGSVGLPEHRKQQPLAQIRGVDETMFEERVTRVPVTGDDRHPVLTHDGAMWTSNPSHAAYVAAELAASVTDPALVVTATVALNPRVRVGQKVALRQRFATGWTRTVTGVVSGRRLTLGGDRDQMTLTVIRTADSVTAPDDPVPPPADQPPPSAPVITPIAPPDPKPPVYVA